MTIKVIKGDTFGRTMRYVNSKTRAPIDLSAAQISATVHSSDFKFTADLPCQILDQGIEANLGRFVIPPVDTTTWPAGQLNFKVTREQAGAKASIKGVIMVEVA